MCVVVALLSVLAVPATYLFARYFLERGWALVAAFLVATSVLHLWYSQQARPHSGAVAVTLLAVLASLRLVRKPTLSSFVLLGLAVGASIATLQSGIATLLPLAAAFLLCSKSRASPWFLVLTLAIAGAIAFALYPSMAGTPQIKTGTPTHFLALDGSTVQLMGHAIFLSSFNGGGIPLSVGALCLYDPLIAACAAIGLAGWIWSVRAARGLGNIFAPRTARRSYLLVALSYALPYAAVIGLYRFSAQRFVIPLLPFLACLGAYGLRELWNLAHAGRFWHRASVGLAIGAVLTLQATAAVRLSSIRSQPDTSTEAATWIRSHIRPNDELVIVSPGIELPLLRTPDALARSRSMLPNANQRWFAYEQSAPAMADTTVERFDLVTVPASTEEDRARLLKDPAGFLRGLGTEWVVLEVHRVYDWRGVAKLRGALGQIGELAARFSPDRIGTWGELPIAYEGFDPRPSPVFWFLRVLQARCTGMVLEIWRVRDR
ncbi:MAG TPA: glycosyltransferase family 39 protein [Planctomycetota bacterium]|nr:glycosyltransferase family 39 protein [Planctomycetota bacterium]